MFLGSWFKPQCRKNMEGVLVEEGGARTTWYPHCRGTREQVTEPINAHIGP